MNFHHGSTGRVMSVHTTLHFRFIESYTHPQNGGIVYFYRPQRSCSKVIFSQVSVILSTGGGVSVLVHAGIHTPLGRYTTPTPGRCPPPGKVQPTAGTPPSTYTLWAGAPPPRKHNPPLRAAIRADGTHPT